MDNNSPETPSPTPTTPDSMRQGGEIPNITKLANETAAGKIQDRPPLANKSSEPVVQAPTEPRVDPWHQKAQEIPPDIVALANQPQNRDVGMKKEGEFNISDAPPAAETAKKSRLAGLPIIGRFF